MTERWRKRLRDLDSAGPSEDVFERAKSGTSMPEEAIPRPGVGSRVVTAVAAFLVFGLAISVFAIPALRLGGDGAGGSGTGMLLPLWPARTLDDLEALQARLDEGDASVAYANDPAETAGEFGRQVLGWPDAVVTEAFYGASGNSIVVDEESGAPLTTYSEDPTVIYPYPGPSTGTVIYPYPGPAEWTGGSSPAEWTGGSSVPSTGAPSPFRMFDLSPLLSCPPNAFCLMRPPSVLVTVYQPLRGDGVWAVLEADSRDLSLDVFTGARVTEGTRIAAGLNYPTTMPSNLGLHIGTGDCSIDLSPGSWISEGPTHGAAELKVSLPPRDGTGCDQVEPGYAFVAVFEDGANSAQDPFAGSSPVVALDAVPVIVEWPEQPVETDAEVTPDTIPSPDESPSPDETEAPLTWTTYTDPMGWTMDVPAGWTVEPFEDFDRVTQTGAVFISGDFSFIPGDAGAVQGLVPAAGEVALFVWHSEGGPVIPPADDSFLPLSYDQLERTPNGWSMSFRANGRPYSILVKPGEGEESISPEHEDTLRRMVESISFEGWETGSFRDGYIALGPVSLDLPLQWITWEGENWLAVDDGDSWMVYGGAPSCPLASLTVSSAGTALVTCEDGEFAEFDSNGNKIAGDLWPGESVLPGYPAIRSWDGQLLVQKGEFG